MFGNDVYGGKYLPNKEDAEWDFCMKAFPWFEDNAPINVIEDNAAEKIDSFNWYLDGAKERIESCRSVLDEIQEAIDNASALVEDMVAEHEKLVSKKEALDGLSSDMYQVGVDVAEEFVKGWKINEGTYGKLTFYSPDHGRYITRTMHVESHTAEISEAVLEHGSLDGSFSASVQFREK